jgi:hypothetical protein
MRLLTSLSNQFKTLKELPEYFYAVRVEWVNVAWGVGLPAIAFIILWSLEVITDKQKIAYFFVFALFMAGYYVWRPNHLRLQKKIDVTQTHSHTWDRQGRQGVQYYFGVVNRSEAITIKQVRVKLKQMIPEIEHIGWLPILLHQQHDNPVSPLIAYAQSFDLHPGETTNVDLLSGIHGEKYFNITHIVPSIDASVQITGRHRLQVEIAGNDIPIMVVWFAVWIDDNGMLRCEME